MSVRLNRHLDVSLTREQEHKMMIRQLNRLIEYLECLPLTIITQDNIEAMMLLVIVQNICSRIINLQSCLQIKIFYN